MTTDNTVPASGGVNTDGTDGIDDDVVRRYPYPLAATYSRAYFQAADLSDMHEYLMDLFEATLKYCAAIVMAQYFQDRLRDPRISRDLLELQRPSLGHWQGWLRDILALYRRENRTLAVPELAAFYRQKHTGSVLEAAQGLQRVIVAMGDQAPAVGSGGITSQQFFELLGEYRNRLAHGARPNPRDREHVAELLGPAMRELYKAMEFLAEYRLVHIREVTLEFDAQQQQRYRYVVTRLTGELPRIATVRNLIDQAFPSKLVYLLDPKADFRPLLGLHPIVVLGYCESCNREQTFMLNMSDADHLDYIAYQCTHHFSPTEYTDYMRDLLNELQLAAGGAPAALRVDDEGAPAQTPTALMPQAPPVASPPMNTAAQTAPSIPAYAPAYPPPPAMVAYPVAAASRRPARLSGKVIVALIAVAVAVFAGAGVAIAAIIGSPHPPPTTLSSNGGTGTGSGDGSSPSPMPKPSGMTSDAHFATIYVPVGFTDSGTKATASCEYDLLSAATAPEQIVYQACSLPSTVTTNQQFASGILTGIQNGGDPNAALCQNPQATLQTVQINGEGGLITADQLCITTLFTLQNSQTYQVQEMYCLAVAQQPGGSVIGIEIAFAARPDQMKDFLSGLPQHEILTQTVFKHAYALP
jgi:hypothetical protein